MQYNRTLAITLAIVANLSTVQAAGSDIDMDCEIQMRAGFGAITSQVQTDQV